MAYAQFLKKIKEYSTIIIHRHFRPDGDAIGSQMGLKDALQTTFPHKKIYAVGDENDRFKFLGRMDTIGDDAYQDSLVIVLDCGERKLISDPRYKLGQYIIKIDHHLAQDDFGDLNIVLSDAVSCAGMIAQIIFSLRLRMTSFGAKALFTGIVTDSGRFRYSSVTASTFMIASQLLGYHFDLSEVYENLYAEDLETVKLRAKMVLNFKVMNGHVAYLINHFADIKKYNTNFSTLSRGMVNVMSGIKGIDIWANFTENENRVWDVELRSVKHDVCKVAVKYGGGGHLHASGFTLTDEAQIDAVLCDLEKLARGQDI